MKCYALTAKGDKVLKRFLGAHKVTEAEKLLVNLELDGDIKEINTKDMIIHNKERMEAEAAGMNIMWMPENDLEAGITVSGLRKRGLNINFGGNK